MKDFYHFCKDIGLDLGYLLAGFFGSAAFISKPNEMTIYQKFLTFVTGMASSMYLTPVVLYFLKLPNNLGYGLAFLLGFTGLKSIEMLIRKYEGNKKSKNN